MGGAVGAGDADPAAAVGRVVFPHPVPVAATTTSSTGSCAGGDDGPRSHDPRSHDRAPGTDDLGTGGSAFPESVRGDVADPRGGKSDGAAVFYDTGSSAGSVVCASTSVGESDVPSGWWCRPDLASDGSDSVDASAAGKCFATHHVDNHGNPVDLSHCAAIEQHHTAASRIAQHKYSDHHSSPHATRQHVNVQRTHELWRYRRTR